MKYTYFIASIAFVFSCAAQERNKETSDAGTNRQFLNNNTQQIGEYITGLLEDSKGNLWFGTLKNGVAKYDGKSLTYITTDDGLPSNEVADILEDKNGNIWFGTHAGLAKYDGSSFTNYTERDGLCHFRISNLLIDSKEVFWIGTWGGVCTFNGEGFTKFPVPNPMMNPPFNKDTKDWITEIMEDSKGNIWIGRDGYGACKYDGKNFVHFTKAEGLYSNNVQVITEDRHSNIWFGTRVAERDYPDPSKRFGKGGVTMYDGKRFSHFPDIEGLNDTDTYGIYKDHSDNIWISTISNGAYKYDGHEFKNYHIPKSVGGMMEDKNGNIWLGCAGGLYCLYSNEIINVTTNGPWK